MLEILILYIQATFKNSFRGIQDVHGLAEQIQRGNIAFPSLYCTNDEYQPLSGDENFLYFRQLSPATEAESEEESVSGCDHYVTRTYPMVAIAYIPKNIFNTDNAFIDSKVSGNIANILRVANYGTLMASMKADEIRAEVTRISTDRYEVWEQEFKGIDMAARFDHVLCAVEFDLIVSATETCLQNFDCNDETVTVEGDTIVVEISDPAAWHKDGDLLTEIKQLGSLNNHNWKIIHNNVTIATIQADGVNLNVLNARATAGTIFLTTENGVIKSRTAAQVRSDIGAGTGSVTSVGLQAGTTGTDVNISGSPVTGSGIITINIPNASATARGLVTIGAQTIAGAKTFVNALTYNEASAKIVLRQWTTDPTYSALYMGNTVPAGANYTIIVSPTGTQTFINASSEINLLISGSLQSRITTSGIVVGTGTALARGHFRAALNGRGLLIESSTAAAMLDIRQTAGATQIGFYGATPVSRQVVPTGSTTDTLITALQNLGLISQS